MTKQETLKILSILKTMYPKSYPESMDFKMLVDIWQETLKDCDYQDVAKAVRAYISTSESNWAPSIGKIRSVIVQLKQPETGRMTAQEAALLVQRAVSNSGYHAQEEFDKLPPVIQRIVRHPQTLFEWSQLDIESFNSVILSNFQRSYKIAVDQVREEAKMPEDLRPRIEEPKNVTRMIDYVSERMKIGGMDK